LELQPREPTFRAIPLGINYAEKILDIIGFNWS
jgi:hypothetical protein